MPGYANIGPVEALTDEALEDIATRDALGPIIVGDRSPAADRRALLAHIRAMRYDQNAALDADALDTARDARTIDALTARAERAERRLAVARSQAQIATQALRLVVELEPEGGTPWL